MATPPNITRPKTPEFPKAPRSAMSRTERQHLVSVTLLNRWALDGKLVQVDLKTRKHALVPPRSVAFSRDFATPLQVQNTERVWAEIERRAALALTALAEGESFDSTPIKDLVALHLVRSHEMMEECHKLFLSYEPLTRLTHLNFEELQLHALARIGLHIVGMEAGHAEQQNINTMIYQHFREELSAHLPNILAQAQGLFQSAGLEIWTCDGVGELVIGDTPAATVDLTGDHIGFDSGVWIGRAGSAFMPLHPNILAAIGTSEMTKKLTRETTERLNLIQYERAQRFVYCRPGSGLHNWVLSEHKKFLDSMASPEGEN